MKYNILQGDCRELMATLDENSVDAIVTDPPYELGFMGKSWDASGVAFDVNTWKEALRVLKPGGHLIAFSGSRTYHRMAVAIEDAGFEIRDQIMWVYGSGFPKSHNISKGIDKNNGEVGRLLKFTTWMRTTGLKAKELDKATGTNMGGHYLTTASQPAIPTVALWAKIRPLIADVPQWVDELVDRIEAEREVVGKYETDMGGLGGQRLGNAGGNITTAHTPAAQQWDGWGTALKPAHEPIVLARKPVVGTVANNVLTYGTGGLNIDGARVGTEVMVNPPGSTNPRLAMGDGWREDAEPTTAAGRWPANFIHDGSDEVVGLFPDSKGMATQKSGANLNVYGGNALNESSTTFPEVRLGFNDSGSAARFFYCAKASKRDRNEGTTNNHPTVKPTTLMQYLVRLVTPPNGTVLDPFLGSGSTGKACAYEGFDFIGMELTAEYIPIAAARIEFALANKDEQLEL